MNQGVPHETRSFTILQRHARLSVVVYYVLFLGGAITLMASSSASHPWPGFSGPVFFLAVYPAIGAALITPLLYHLRHVIPTDALDRSAHVFAGIAFLVLIYYFSLAAYFVFAVFFLPSHMC